MALDNFSELGYNTEFQSGYNPSARHDTTREAFAKYKGIDISKGMPEYMLNEYNTWRDYWNSQDESYLSAYNTAWETWYNSPEEQLKRYRGIGQNAFYTDGIGQQASSSAVTGAHQSQMENEKNGPLGRVMSVLGGVTDSLSQIGGLVSTIQGRQADIDLTNQKALGQFLDNAQQMRFLGMDYRHLNNEFGEHSNNALLYGYGNKRKSALFGSTSMIGYGANSLFDVYQEARNNSLIQGGLNKQFVTENILPLQVKGLELRNSLQQLDYKQQEQYYREVWPKVMQMQIGQAEFNPKALIEEFQKKYGDTLLGGIAVDTVKFIYMLHDVTGGISFGHTSKQGYDMSSFKFGW